MTTIEINIEEDGSFLEELGKQKLQEMVQQYIDFKQFELISQHIDEGMKQATQESGIDWEMEFEKTRQEAWEEYKIKRGL